MCSQPVDIGYTDVMNKPRGKFVDLAQSIHAELTIHELYSLTSDMYFPMSLSLSFRNHPMMDLSNYVVGPTFLEMLIGV